MFGALYGNRINIEQAQRPILFGVLFRFDRNFPRRSSGNGLRIGPFGGIGSSSRSAPDSRIVPFTTPADAIRAEAPAGIILSGGPASVYQENAPKCDPEIFELGIPILGICYGLQLTVATLGGTVSRGQARERAV